MAKTAENTEAQVPPFEAVLNELRYSEHLTPARVVELLQMLPPAGVTKSSAEVIRELRGPLPGDE